MWHKNATIRVFIWMVVLVAGLLIGRTVDGHAILKESSPPANSSVTGPDVPITLKFNVRIDAARSKLQLVHPDNAMRNLVLDQQASPDTLTTKAAGLQPGAYKIA